MNDNRSKDGGLLISRDCLECVHCKNGKILEDRNIRVKCTLENKGLRVNASLAACPHHQFKMFEQKDMKSFLPYHIWIEITNACNLKCKMCGQRGTDGYLNAPDSDMRRKNLPIETWKDFIDDVKSIRPTILLRGGEPLLYPEIDELMRHIAESNLFLSMDTNGTQMKKHAHAIVKYVDHVNVSIDGPRETHDFVRGVSGTYDSAREGIIALKNACKELGIRQGQRIAINFVVSPDNYASLPEMIDVSEDLGVKDINLTLCFQYDDDVANDYNDTMERCFNIESRAGTGFRKDKKEIDGDLLVNNIRSLMNSKKGINFSLQPNVDNESIKQWFEESSLPVAYDRCYSPWFLVNIMPNGDVNFCADVGDYIIGNITEESLLDIWFNEKAEKFRKRILEERFSICRRCVVNLLYPYNRFDSLMALRNPTRILKYGTRLPFVGKFCRKHEWLTYSFY